MGRKQPYETLAFRELLALVRSGDPEASAELVRQYEPDIRLAIRARLTDPRLRRLLDSMDICQSVLASFFVRVGAGQYELDQPEQLLRLLKTMARNKLFHAADKQRACRRDYRRQDTDPLPEEIPNSDPRPDEVAAQRELLTRFHDRLSPRDRRIVELRRAGRTWREVAAEVGGKPDGVRMGHARLVDRFIRQMGLEG
jgi:RNA polymerase sigma factor (sigma-70 family)